MSQMKKTLGRPKSKPAAGGHRGGRPARPGTARARRLAPVLLSERGRSLAAGLSRSAPSTLIRSLKAGFPVGVLDELRGQLDLPMEKLVPMLGISKATLHRRMLAGRLDPAESDRVVRYTRLLDKAITVLESVEDARRWLSAPQFGLGGAIPLEYAETEVGAREVEDLLGRIEYGVYS